MMPKVSVILPVYNNAHELPRALNGLLQQEYTDFEIVAVDDGATDGAGELLDRYRFRDSRIRVIHQANQGIAAALNRSIKEANGIYLARHDADDVSAPTRFARQVEYLDSHPDAAFCATWACVVEPVFGPMYDVTMPDRSRRIVSFLESGWNPIIHGSTMIRRSALERLETGYRGGYAEDMDLWLRLSMVGRIGMVCSVEYYYWLSPDGLSYGIPEKGEMVARLALQLHAERMKGGQEITSWQQEFAKIKALPVCENAVIQRQTIQKYYQGVIHLLRGEFRSFRQTMKLAAAGKGLGAEKACWLNRLAWAAPLMLMVYRLGLTKIWKRSHRYIHVVPSGSQLPSFAQPEVWAYSTQKELFS